MTSLQPAAKQRFYYLDSARGLAALSVITWHFIAAVTDINMPGTAVTSPIHFFWYGQADVIFFFIHSGFILAYSYTGDQKTLTPVSYIKFLIERVFRIYPLFIFILILSYFLKNSIFPISNGGFTSAGLHEFWAREYNLASVFKQAVLFIAIPKEGNLRLIPQDWTLTVELVAGAMIPFMAFIARRNVWIYWPAIFIAIVVLHMNTYLFEFAMGVFLFHQWDQIRILWQRAGMFIKCGAVGLAIVLYSCFFQFPSLFNTEQVVFRPGVDRFIVIMGCCLFFCVTISSAAAQKILSLPLLVTIGRICYSIYLVHMVLLICFADYMMAKLRLWIPLWYPGQLFVAFGIFLITTILVSYITYAIIEKPFNRIGKVISAATGTHLQRLLKK